MTVTGTAPANANPARSAISSPGREQERSDGARSELGQETGTEEFEQGKELKASWKEGPGVRTVTLSLSLLWWHSLPILQLSARHRQ